MGHLPDMALGGCAAMALSVLDCILLGIVTGAVLCMAKGVVQGTSLA